MNKQSFLGRIGIIHHVGREDMLFFFIPWLTVMALEVFFCSWKSARQSQSLVDFAADSVIGMALFVFGFVIIMAGHFTLWRNYSSFLVIHKDHKLITHGIYRFIRNPIYLGTIMALIALPVFAGSLYGFLSSLLLIPVFLIRIRMEERMLSDYFQDSFQEYKKTTKRLIPFIY